MFAPVLTVLALLLPPAAPQTDLRATSIVLVEGIRGGNLPPSRHRTVTFSYDWNRGAFRAVEQYLEPTAVPNQVVRAFRALEFEGDRFRKLVDRVVELGLPELPLELPAECEDLYGRNTGIRFHHAGRVWENKGPLGCEHVRSLVPVTPKQVAAFDAVLALLNGTLAAGPLQPASELDAPLLQDRGELEIRELERAVEVLREMGQAGEVDANAAVISGFGMGALTVSIPGRDGHPCRSDFHYLVDPTGWWELRFSFDGERVQVVHDTPVPGIQARHVSRRKGFVEAHPELSAPQRDLILAGWVGEGMSEGMVCAAWGSPIQRTVERDTVVLHFKRGGRNVLTSQVTLRIGAAGLQRSW